MAWDFLVKLLPLQCLSPQVVSQLLYTSPEDAERSGSGSSSPMVHELLIWSFVFLFVKRPTSASFYPSQCCPLTLCCGGSVHSAFRSLSKEYSSIGTIPYVVADLLYPWKKARSSGSSCTAIFSVLRCWVLLLFKAEQLHPQLLSSLHRHDCISFNPTPLINYHSPLSAF